MNDFEKEYDKRFNELGRRPEALYIDILLQLFGIEIEYFTKLQENYIITPHHKLSRDIEILINNKKYSEIFNQQNDNQEFIFDKYGLLEAKFDNIHVFELIPINWINAICADINIRDIHLREVRQHVGPLFPSKIKGYSVLVKSLYDRNYEPFVLTTYDHITGKNLHQTIKQYENWFRSHVDNLAPRFQTIADEVRDYLLNSYKVNPQKDGFVEWFMNFKMNTVFAVQADANTDEAYIDINFDVLNNNVTPTVIEQDLHEYCQWRTERHQNAHQAVTKSSKSSSGADKPKKPSSKHSSTEVRDKRLKELVDNFMKLEGKLSSEAIKLAAEKEGCSPSTVERAIGFRKR